MKKFVVLTLSVFLIVLVCSSIVSAEKIKLEFFQSKEEVVDLFDELIEKFEKENPDIDIEQNSVPSAGVVLKARLVKNDMPDILAIGGDFAYAR